ncbi:hypothetical protein [Thalassolituus sp. UBA2009]|uniref:hypothetical protein n=1 Tax=Thalassolituus sp. UBA2009 TaxID=1947658 RepID=UPI00257BE935|nr:hypothetical protein [Thalassolituus sp. UBA2009]
MAKTYLKSFAFWNLFLTVFLFFFYLLGSRSVVFFYLLAVIATLLYFNGLSVKIWLGILLLLVVIILGSIFFSDFLTDNRVAKMSLTDLSVKNRLLYLVFAVEEILKSPFWGSYGAYAIEFDDVATYPHNLILAWLNNGVLGFVIYLGVVLYPLFFYVGNRRSLLDVSRKFDSFLVLLFFSFLMYFFTLIKVVISDHYLTLYLGLALGSFSCVAYRYRTLK